MRTLKKITQEVVVVDEVRCNKCGELCSTPVQEDDVKARGNNHRDWYGLIEVGFTTGYFSSVLPDGMAYRFSLCEPCVKELMDTFKISAEEEGCA